MPAELLQVDRISVRFGGITALDGVSFSVATGHIVGLIGPNGAGKTTLFNCLSRLYRFDEGSIRFDGVTPWVNVQIVQDPGKRYALFGAIVAIFGLLASLFTRRRRIWIRYREDGTMEVAGLAKNGAPGLENEIRDLVTDLQKGGK